MKVHLQELLARDHLRKVALALALLAVVVLGAIYQLVEAVMYVVLHNNLLVVVAIISRGLGGDLAIYVVHTIMDHVKRRMLAFTVGKQVI